MKNDMRFLHDLMSKMDGRLDDIAEVQVKQQVILEQHIRRSEANEAAVEELKKVHNMMVGVAWFIGFVGTVVGVYAVFKG